MFLAALVLGVVLGWFLTWILQDRVNKDLQNQNDRLERDLAAAQLELAAAKSAATDSAQAEITEEVAEVEVGDDGEIEEEALVVEESAPEEVAADMVAADMKDLSAEEEIADVIETAEALAVEGDVEEQIAIDRQALSDLTQIRGIGPKYAETLHAAGYTTIAELAEATPEQLREIMPPETHNLAHFEDWIAQADDIVNQ